MTSSRDRIFSRVKAALAPLPQRAPLPDWDRDLIRMRNAQPAVDLWAQFAERLKAVNGTPLTTVAELVALLEKNNWRHGYCDPALWPRFQDALAGFKVETTFDRTRVDDYAFGITAAAGAIAETGTLILTDQGTSSRLGALAPWLHVAVLRRDQILPDITSALLPPPCRAEASAKADDPNVIWVTGPSKTADVEGILIEGVHGPGIQVALLID
jgi:L-lactate dehydrogenase complex protein LldG